MEIILFVVIGVIISIVSAAGKKKQNPSSEEAPVRPTMSDIQKAFMLFGETETQPQREPKQVERQAAARSVAAKQTEKAAERLSARTFETTPAYHSAAPQNKYANINLERFHSGEADISNDMPLKAVKKQRSALGLFEDKNDFVRAVIYSEILTRKAR